jgi:hypothetical protein
MTVAINAMVTQEMRSQPSVYPRTAASRMQAATGTATLHSGVPKTDLLSIRE